MRSAERAHGSPHDRAAPRRNARHRRRFAQHRVCRLAIDDVRGVEVVVHDRRFVAGASREHVCNRHARYGREIRDEAGRHDNHLPRYIRVIDQRRRQAPPAIVHAGGVLHHQRSQELAHHWLAATGEAAVDAAAGARLIAILNAITPVSIAASAAFFLSCGSDDLSTTDLTSGSVALTTVCRLVFVTVAPTAQTLSTAGWTSFFSVSAAPPVKTLSAFRMAISPFAAPHAIATCCWNVS